MPGTVTAIVVGAVVVLLIVVDVFVRTFNSVGFPIAQIVFAVILVAFVAFGVWALLIRRDVGAGLAVAAGLVTGLVSAVVSAPIAAYVFGGVTGFGGDAVIAAFRVAGAGLYQAVLAQSLLSDPLDKMIECLIVFLILLALPRRIVARFPNGERVVGVAAPLEPSTG
jgi:energy-coupling factor transport system substrate-specific component